MKKFLVRTAEYLYQLHGDAVADICIVLPNRRAGLYLKKYLADLAGKTIWAPSIFSVEDFMMRLSHLKECDQTETLFELYEVHKILEKEKAQEFVEFIHWGQQLLSDFNEIDSYLVNPEELFSFLTEAKMISLWNLENTPLTDFEKQYLHFFNSLQQYHEMLSARLLAEGQAYQGLLFRQTAEMLPELLKGFEWKKVVFAGFNAMTRAEEMLIDSLVNSGKAELLWDADGYYVDDPDQEAGYFLRNWRKKWKTAPFQWIDDDFKTSAKSVKVTGVPLHVGQAKYCGELLQEISSGTEAQEEVAVVMMDEQMLIPLLNSFPAGIKEFNITMGLPLKQTPMFDLLESIFGMHINSQRFVFARKSDHVSFYFRDVLKVLQHPYVTGIADAFSEDSPFSLGDLIHSIKNGNKVFLGKNNLYQFSAGLFTQHLSFLDPLFEPWNDPGAALKNLSMFLSSLREGLSRRYESSETSRGNLELEYLFAFSKIVFRLVSLTRKFDSVKDLKTLSNLFVQIAGFTSLPFYGEPLKGIQVMGMLETRTLDFDRVILLSANEDLLPAGKTSQSFIPYDIRRTFQLPTYRTKFSIFGYHFYRLLQRASQVNLLYNTEADELGGGEKSRFIKQIMHELHAYNPKVELTEEILATPLKLERAPEPVEVPKTGEVYELLMKKAESGMSATSINNFIQCPLKFYFRDLAGLQEPDEIKDTIDAQILGSSVHKALEMLYAPYKGRQLEKSFLEQMLEGHETAVDQAFEKKYQGSDLSIGKNQLLVKVGKIMVRRFLRIELENLENLVAEGIHVNLLDLEKFVDRKIDIASGGKKIRINLKGFIDRLDRVGEMIRIIDYKSGRVSSKDLVLDEWEDLKDDPAASMILQLLTYVYLVSKNGNNSSSAILPGIIGLRKLNEGLMKVRLPGKDKSEDSGIITREDLLSFEKILMEVLAAVFDPSLPFCQTDDSTRCRNCDFFNLCVR